MIEPSGRIATRRRLEGRRRIALALVAYGLAGLTLAVGSLIALTGPVAAVDQLAGRQADAVHWLDLTATALADAERSSTGAAQSLADAQVSARSAADLFRELSSTMAGLREATTITVLGSQPLGGLTDDFDRVARQSAVLSDEMGTLSTSLATEAATFEDLAADAGRLEAEIADLRAVVLSDELAALADRLHGLTVLAVLLLGWLVLPALASLAVGVRQLRRLSRINPPMAVAVE